MTSSRTAVRMLRAADPTPKGTAAVDERALADLRRILDSPQKESGSSLAAERDRGGHRSGGRHRLAPALAAAAAAVVVAAAAVGTGTPWPWTGSSAYAATPGSLRVIATAASAGLNGDATAVLDEIARRTAALPDDTGSGRYAKTVNDSWALWTRVDGEQVSSEVVPETHTTWAAADGSGRSISTRGGPGDDSETVDERLGTGEHSFMWPLGSLSADDTELARQLEQSHPVVNGAAERLVAVTDLVAEQPLPPTVRAAVLRYLARTPGLTVDGIVSDRAGRRGVALHLDTDMSGLPERRSLIVDSQDGRVLGSETTLTQDAGKLNVPIPSVISYTTFRSAQYVEQLD